MRDLDDLLYFSSVAEHGGFSVAARALKLPKSKLSRRVSALERRLGARLLMRHSQGVTLTPVGTAFLGHCQAMIDAAQSAHDVVALSRAEPRGTVRLSCPAGLIHQRLAPVFSSFMARHPHVNLYIEAVGRPVDPVREGFDIALRVRTLPLADSDLHMRALAASPHRLVARAGLVRPNADPFETLAEQTALSENRPDSLYVWHLLNAQGDARDVSYQPRLITDDLTMLRQAAINGLGVVQLPLLVVDADLAAGRLVDVMPGWAPADRLLHAVYASRSGQLPAVRSLLDHLAASIREVDYRESPLS